MKIKLCSFLLVNILLLSATTMASSRISEENTNLFITNETNIVEMIQQIDESLVFYYHDNLMKFGARYTGTINCTLAGQYLYNEFEEMGLDVAFHEWQYDGVNSRNVVGTLPGSDPISNAIFIMSAHYDCTPGSLGADDDGSGVAAVMTDSSVELAVEALECRRVDQEVPPGS